MELILLGMAITPHLFPGSSLLPLLAVTLEESEFILG